MPSRTKAVLSVSDKDYITYNEAMGLCDENDLDFSIDVRPFLLYVYEPPRKWESKVHKYLYDKHEINMLIRKTWKKKNPFKKD